MARRNTNANMFDNIRRNTRKKTVYKNASYVWNFMAIMLGLYFWFLGKKLYGGLVVTITLMLAPWFVRFLRKKIKEKAYLHSSIYQVDHLSGHDFEDFLCANLRRLGYKVENVGSGGNDYGVDLIIRKNGKKTAVQAKRYKGKVGIEAVQQIVAGAEYYGCKNRMVITNSYFTPAAKRLAAKCNVTLWDRDDCQNKLVTVKE